MEERISMRTTSLLLTTALLLGACASVTEPTVPSAPEPPPVQAAPAPAVVEPPAPVTPAPVPAAPEAKAEVPAEPPAPPPPRMRLDPDADAERLSLWDRIRAGYALPALDNELVQRWEQFYARQPDYVQRMVSRGGLYLFHIVEEVERRQMPTELALLPFIESAFNPQAMSHARASGMWQFMPATGKAFELQQNLFRDDRRDVLASTRAALDYLQQLHGMFDDWHLALAAYNWGQGNVRRAIDNNRRAGLGTDYLSLRMPDETRNYVPKLQAVMNLIANPQRFGLTLPPLENHPQFVSVPIERDIDVALAARLAGVPLEEFRALNPQMNKPVILAAGTPQVLLPYDNANSFVQALQQRRGSLATWTAWVAPRTVSPAEAARLTGMDESDLREVNKIPRGMLVRAGSTLLVPRGERSVADVPEHVADTAMMVLAPEPRPLRRVVYKAGRGGESVAAVAKRFRVSPAQVARWNDVSAGGRFRAGQPVVVMLAQPARRPSNVSARSAQPAPRAAAKAVPRAASKVTSKNASSISARPAAKSVAKAAPPSSSKAAPRARAAQAQPRPRQAAPR
jgi:membrane-bound lytic murein transglycosylase D